MKSDRVTKCRPAPCSPMVLLAAGCLLALAGCASPPAMTGSMQAMPSAGAPPLPAAPMAAPGASAAARTLSQRVSVTGAVARPSVLDVAALRALPVATLSLGANVYSGVDLWQLLDTTVGLKTDTAAMNGSIAMVIVATGSDGYRAVLSVPEIDPGFGHRKALLAYAMNGGGLGRNGDIRLIVADDVKAGRSVANLVSITVVAADGKP